MAATIYMIYFRSLMKSTNEGVDWSTVKTDSDDIYAIIVGDAGQTINYSNIEVPKEIVRTINGGASWNVVFAPTVQVIDFCKSPDNDDYLFGCCGAGYIVRSTDGGANWTETRPAQAGNQHLYGIHFISNTVGWAVGNGGRIIKTTDGGANWTQQTCPGAAGRLNDVFFVDANNGWAIFYDNTRGILRTTNGGTDWIELAPAGQLYIGNSLFALDEDYVWFTTFNHTLKKYEIFRSTDGGDNWNSYTITSPLTGFVSSWISIFFVSALVGYVGCGQFYKSTNGGATFSLQGQSGANDYSYGRGFFDISFDIEYREFDITTVEPTDRVTDGSVVSASTPLIYDSQESGDSNVKCIIFRAKNLGIYSTISNMKFFLNSRTGFEGDNSYYCDITDSWTQDKSVAQVSGGTPGTISQSLPPSANITKNGGGDIEGLTHADTSQYIYLALNIGEDEVSGFKDLTYRVQFDYI